jgi:hypothetical protein
VTLTDRLIDKDPAVRAAAAGDLVAAANAVAEAARAVRDRDAREMLRQKVRPADVGRTISMTRAQMARYKAGEAAPAEASITAGALVVADALNELIAVIDSDRQPATA